MATAASATRRLSRNAASLFRQSSESQPNHTNDIMAALGNSEEHKYQVQDDEDNDNDRLPKDKEGTHPKDLVLVLSKSVAIRCWKRIYSCLSIRILVKECCSKYGLSLTRENHRWRSSMSWNGKCRSSSQPILRRGSS